MFSFSARARGLVSTQLRVYRPARMHSGQKPPPGREPARRKIGILLADGGRETALTSDRPPSGIAPMTCYLARYEYFLVFTAEDPRLAGWPDPIEDEIWLDDGGLSERMPNGSRVGRSPVDNG